jgi:glycosyltransferase involved in cell wall biosynthesis
MTTLRIAMIGLRGLPAQAGGVERHVEELATRLVGRGHDVTVFCRPGYSADVGATYRGVRLASLPTIRARGGEALVHSGLCALATVRQRYDVAHFHAVGPGLFTPVARAVGKCAVVQTIHGMDDERAKWGGAAQRVLRAGALLSAHVPDEVVVVSQALKEHYRERYGRYTTYIGNGAPTPGQADLGRLAKFGLKPRGYVVFVGRMVPVGDSSHTDSYMARLRELAAEDPRVLLVGYQFGADLAALFAGASAFAQPSLLEGLPITLLEAAAYRVPVVASDIPPHLEVLGSGGLGRVLFRAGDLDGLRAALETVLGTDPIAAGAAADQLRADVSRRYDWDVATDRLEAAYLQAIGRRRGKAMVPSVRSAAARQTGGQVLTG